MWVHRDGAGAAGETRPALGVDHAGIRTAIAAVLRTDGKAFVPFGVGYVELPGQVRVETRLTECDPAALVEGMEMELAVIPSRTDDEGNEVVTFGFDPSVIERILGDRRQQMDVAIVGVGLHPFGRFGEVTGIQMGAVAKRHALADAGVEWRDIQFAFGGSYEVDNPDAAVALMGLMGIPFTDVYNGCATVASALTLAANTIRLGEYDLGIAVGMDKHLPGVFSADPREYACPSWYGEVGQFVTTKFFGMKINKYMHEHGISQSSLAKVAAKNYRNGAMNPNVFRRKPMSEEQILESPMLNYPLTQYMFCSPDEGAAAVVLCRADHASRYTDTPIYLRASTVRTRRLGAFEVHRPWLPIEETSGATVDASRAPTRWRESGRKMST